MDDTFMTIMRLNTLATLAELAEVATSETEENLNYPKITTATAVKKVKSTKIDYTATEINKVKSPKIKHPINNKAKSPKSRIKRKTVHRTRVDPFETLDDKEFKDRYKFDKKTVRWIVDLVRGDITRCVRGGGVSPELQVLVALRCWAGSRIQNDAAAIHGLSQPFVSMVCARVADALAHLQSRFIHMPHTTDEQEKVVRQFESISGFPNIIGAIDSTHIKIRKAKEDAAPFYVQVISDAKLRICDIETSWGDTNNARNFNQTKIRKYFEDNEYKYKLLGDHSNDITPYLCTPILNPQTLQEDEYNDSHSATHGSVKNCFEVWKQRFRYLQSGLTVAPKNCGNMIIALAVLHNIALDMADDTEGECWIKPRFLVVIPTKI
ncbi:unnamed protein product [Plutella xylostella]|uniref:(diamondback moth) hypothetical protein n=1 Tax=Plutella xylostella TaxID=51655 RepID=A0A8S4FNP9_PLUXY|nr:unnamed protein product [Plutella xylostella]